MQRNDGVSYCTVQNKDMHTQLFMGWPMISFGWPEKLSIYPDLRITSDQIKSAAKGWSERESYSGHTLNERWTSDRFVRVATKWLRFLGCLQRTG